MASQLGYLLSISPSCVRHVFCKWIPAATSMTFSSASSASALVPPTSCGTPSLWETAFVECVLIWDINHRDGWDIVSICSDGLLGAVDFHCRHLLYDLLLVGRQLVDGRRDLGCDCSRIHGCIIVAILDPPAVVVAAATICTITTISLSVSSPLFTSRMLYMFCWTYPCCPAVFCNCMAIRRLEYAS